MALGLPRSPLDMAGVESLVSGMQAQWLRQEVLANNLANLSTPGFKRDDIAIAPTASDAGLTLPAAARVNAIGSMPVVEWTDFSQGALHQTGRDLDIALNGPGFLVVDTPNGQRYTRAGVLEIGQNGTIVTASGLPVVGDNGAMRVTGRGPITIDASGEIREGGAQIGTLRLVDFQDPQRLVKEGDGLFAAPIGLEPVPTQSTSVVSHALEDANVNTVRTMVSMIGLLRTYEATQRALQAINQTNQQATGEIGKTA